MCLHPGGAFPSLGCVMETQTVLMATTSGRTAPEDLALKTISPAVMDSVSRTHTGELGIKIFPDKLPAPMGVELPSSPLGTVVTVPQDRGIFCGQ